MNSISFKAHNPNKMAADKILHKINTDFPAVSPWKTSLYYEKRGFKNYMGTPVFYTRMELFRDSIDPDFFSDYKYAAKTIEGIKHFKAANCKEYAEIAYLIAKANDIKNCYCANLSVQLSENLSKLKDLGHCVMLIFRDKADEGLKFAHKFYVDSSKRADIITPPRDTIVVDPIYGIADYWDCALQKYGASLFPSFNNNKGKVVVELRKPLLSSDKDLKKLKTNYPLLSLTDKTKKMKHRYKFRKEDRIFEIFKAENLNIFSQRPPVTNSMTLKERASAFFSFI